LNIFARQAKLRYEDGTYTILEGGDYVLCAVTGKIIPLSHLRYWSVEWQEAYATADAVLKRHLEQTK